MNTPNSVSKKSGAKHWKHDYHMCIFYRELTVPIFKVKTGLSRSSASVMVPCGASFPVSVKPLRAERRVRREARPARRRAQGNLGLLWR